MKALYDVCGLPARGTPSCRPRAPKQVCHELGCRVRRSLKITLWSMLNFENRSPPCPTTSPVPGRCGLFVALLLAQCVWNVSRLMNTDFLFSGIAWVGHQAKLSTLCVSVSLHSLYLLSILSLVVLSPSTAPVLSSSSTSLFLSQTILSATAAYCTSWHIHPLVIHIFSLSSCLINS